MRSNVKIITQDASCLMTHDARYNVQCNQSVQIVVSIPLIGIPFFKILLRFYCCCLIPIPMKNLLIPLTVGTHHYTLLPAREVFDFLLQSSASGRELNSSFAFCPCDMALHCLYTKPIYSKILIKDTKLINQPHAKGS